MLLQLEVIDADQSSSRRQFFDDPDAILLWDVRISRGRTVNDVAVTRANLPSDGRWFTNNGEVLEDAVVDQFTHGFPAALLGHRVQLGLQFANTNRIEHGFVGGSRPVERDLPAGCDFRLFQFLLVLPGDDEHGVTDFEVISTLAGLRKTSLDEIPQLLNVLRGTMSLVGPRPLPAYHFEDLPEQVRFLREKVQPGITGLWQVSGRSEAGTAGMEKWDPYYVRNWSIWLDIVIIARTFKAVFCCRGAY